MWLCEQLDQASLGLSREYLNRGMSDKLVQAYYDYMVDIATLLGADRARAQQELKEALQFEIELANVSTWPRFIVARSFLRAQLSM